MFTRVPMWLGNGFPWRPLAFACWLLTLPGGAPAAVVAAEPNAMTRIAVSPDGILRLDAARCRTAGKTLKYMEKEQALGWWNSTDDRAEWAIDVPRAGTYEVWLDWSCPGESAGNTFLLQCGAATLRGKIGNTRSWQTYRLDRLGTMSLPQGDCELSLQAEGAIKVALADVRQLRLVPVSEVGSKEAPRERLPALIVDGQNNHDWQSTSPILRDVLNDCGRFVVDIATSPAAGEEMSGFRPPFDRYRVVVSNYNGQAWPASTREALVKFVRGGGGLVIVHAANNAFPDWPEYNEMIGLGWRGAEFGTRLTVSDAGEVLHAPAGAGPGAGHGPQHEYVVVLRDTAHSITRGLPRAWLHTKDELYHGQRGPAANLHVLATAYSDPAGGTGAHEPLVWVIPYGQGRVFTTLLGHADYSMRCHGFQVLLARGAEWAATGNVAP